MLRLFRNLECKTDKTGLVADVSHISTVVKQAASDAGFELSGIAPVDRFS